MVEPRVVLVLGAGGITGGAYEHGVLAALAARTGWEPAHARAFIGTSAGSWGAASLATGRTLAETLAATQPPAPRGNRLRRTARGVANRVLGDGSGLYTPALRVPTLSPRAWLQPGGILVESGIFSTAGMARRLRVHLGDAGDSWPYPALRIVAYDTRRLRRTVFGAPGVPRATLIEAVTASSAVPGLFRPVMIEGVPYLDGGIASTTHLDLAAEFAGDADLVICIAPMAGDQIGGRPPAGLAAYGYRFTETLARVARGQLEREAASLRAAHPSLALLIIRPGPEDRRAMGINFMDGGRREPVRRQAYRSTLALLDREEVKETLARHMVV